MRKSAEVPNEVELDVGGGDKRRSRRYPFSTEGLDSVVMKLYDTAREALSIVAVAIAANDSDFFADFSNLERLYRFFGAFSINTGDAVPTKERFAANPIEEWVGLIALLFVALRSLPNHGGVYCERVVYGDKSDYMSMMLPTDVMDGVNHVMGLMVTSDGVKYVLLDNEVMMQSGAAAEEARPSVQ